MSRQNGIHDVDVAVLGGGPAGAAVALELVHRGYSALVIERSDYRDTRIGETLPPQIQPLLTSLGVWDRFLAQNHSRSFGIRSAWGQDDLHENDFIFNPYGAGWHIDRPRFDAMLAQCAEEAGTIVYRGAGLLSCAKDNAGNWNLGISCDGRKIHIHAKFVVDATGRRSYVARKQGAKRVTCDRLIGVYHFLSLGPEESAPDNSTLIEAAENGWWYSAVQPDSGLVLAYMTDADLYARDGKRTTNQWLRRVDATTHTRSRVAHYALRTGPHIVAANSSHLDFAAYGSWLAIGDAAMSFDPLAGQGVNKALESAAHAAQTIRDHWTGNKSVLRNYADVIQRDFSTYFRMRQRFYARVRRWPKSAFWQRRIAASTGSMWT